MIGWTSMHSNNRTTTFSANLCQRTARTMLRASKTSWPFIAANFCKASTKTGHYASANATGHSINRPAWLMERYARAREFERSIAYGDEYP